MLSMYNLKAPIRLYIAQPQERRQISPVIDGKCRVRAVDQAHPWYFQGCVRPHRPTLGWALKKSTHFKGTARFRREGGGPLASSVSAIWAHVDEMPRADTIKLASLPNLGQNF